jgi:hypothetical protein
MLMTPPEQQPLSYATYVEDDMYGPVQRATHRHLNKRVPNGWCLVHVVSSLYLQTGHSNSHCRESQMH